MYATILDGKMVSRFASLKELMEGFFMPRYKPGCWNECRSCGSMFVAAERGYTGCPWCAKDASRRYANDLRKEREENYRKWGEYRTGLSESGWPNMD